MSKYIAGAATVLIILVPVLAGVYLIRNQKPPPRQDAAPTATTGPINDVVTVQMPQSALDTVLGGPGGKPDTAVKNTRIDFIDNGKIIPINNGEAVPLGDRWHIEIFVSPYPPDSFEATVDFYLTTLDGDPVTDAVFNNGFDMAFMYHGRIRSHFENIGGGHYVSSLEFLMYGLWEFDTSIQIPGEPREEILLWDLYVWPVG